MAAGRPELKSILMKQQGAARGQRKQALWHPALRSRKIARFPGGQHRGFTLVCMVPAVIGNNIFRHVCSSSWFAAPAPPTSTLE